ncbi:MAG: DUF4398 domain-containing protein [Lautropia sp.]
MNSIDTSAPAVGRRPTRWLAVTVGSLALAACASAPNPTSEMATARAAVDSAQRADAGGAAPAEMAEARRLLTVAEKAQSAEDYVDARRAAEKARATAELAEEKARLAKANEAKAEIDGALQALRNEAATRPVR